MEIIIGNTASIALCIVTFTSIAIFIDTDASIAIVNNSIVTTSVPIC